MACGIFPDQGSNPCPLHWQADSQPLRHQGSPFSAFFGSCFSGFPGLPASVWPLGALPLWGLLSQASAGALHSGGQTRGLAWWTVGVVSFRKVPLCPRVVGALSVVAWPPQEGLLSASWPVSMHRVSGPSSAQKPLMLSQPSTMALGPELTLEPPLLVPCSTSSDTPPEFCETWSSHQGDGPLLAVRALLQEFGEIAHLAVEAGGALPRARHSLGAGHPHAAWLEGCLHWTGTQRAPGVYRRQFTSTDSLSRSCPMGRLALVALVFTGGVSHQSWTAGV